MTPLLFLCVVAGVHDGDTLRCQDGTRVRLAAIDAPEMPGACRQSRHCVPGDPYRARDALRRLVGGKQLRCTITGRSYDRAVAWCHADGHDVSCAMVRGGWTKYLPQFDRQQRICG